MSKFTPLRQRQPAGALMYKTRTELEMEKELAFEKLSKTLSVKQLDLYIRVLELEKELLKREVA